MCIRDSRKVVDVHLAPGALELVEHIRDQPSHHPTLRQRDEHDDVLLREEGTQILLAWWFGPICVRFAEGFAKHRVELSNLSQIGGSEPLNEIATAHVDRL